jgi:2-hydroxy-6-oxonona-2,4-dienedioate hydrolase
MRKFIATMAFDSSYVTDEFIAERVEILNSRPEHIEGWISGHGKPMVRIDQTRLADIKAPTLLIHGRDDRTVPFTAGLHLVRNIPDARLLLVTRCGHWVQLEHTDEFNRSVASFILG